ncbi:MAG: hypothetical protein HY921_04480 [Elusimicrobia bacterium]|nr:hypothetical protein [Elusimicrobiota bacterium]
MNGALLALALAAVPPPAYGVEAAFPPFRLEVPPIPARPSLRALARAAAGSVPLNVVQINLGLLRVPGVGDIVAYVDRRARLMPRVVGELSLEKDVDVFVFEELWEEGHAKILAAELEGRGYTVIRPSRKPFPFLQGSGMMVAVKEWIPILEAYYYLFEDRANYERNVYKGMVLLTLKPLEDAPPMVLVGAHLQSVPDPRADDSIAAQKGQIRQIGRIIGEHARKGAESLVLLCDCNLQDDQENYKSLTEGLGLADVMSLLYPGREAPSMSPENPLNRMGPQPLDRDIRIDYVWARGGAKAGVTPVEAQAVFNRPYATSEGPLYLSDHYGVYARLSYGVEP